MNWLPGDHEQLGLACPECFTDTSKILFCINFSVSSPQKLSYSYSMNFRNTKPCITIKCNLKGAFSHCLWKSHGTVTGKIKFLTGENLVKLSSCWPIGFLNNKNNSPFLRPWRSSQIHIHLTRTGFTASCALENSTHAVMKSMQVA